MRSYISRTGRWSAIAVAISLICCAQSLAKKPPEPDNPGGGGKGGDPPAYRLIDLLGFENGDLGYQSSAEFIASRNLNGDVLIGGTSYQRYVDALWVNHPALWYVDIDGNFNEPTDLGLPSFALEARPSGMNGWGVAVGGTGRAVEKDEDGDWVFPSWVNVPGLDYQELPAIVGRNSQVAGINDAGVMIGTLAIEDQNSPSGYWTVSVIWRLNEDGSPPVPEILGDFYPKDINNHGVMAGRASSGYPAIAWFDENGGLVVQQLETTDEQYLWADVNALNDVPTGDVRLTVVGARTRSGFGEAFIWRPFDAANATTLLGTLGGRDTHALDVNNSGDVVGWSETKRQGHQAFIYSNGTMSNLNSLTNVGLNTLQWAQGINDDGDIIGFMRIPRPISEQRGFLLRPIPKE